MIEIASPPRRQLTTLVVSNRAVSGGLLILELELPEPVAFLPGQFAMLNFTTACELIFSRPFSILSVREERVLFLYRVIGRGTARLATSAPGEQIIFLGPLGTPFPAPEPDRPILALAGGVGLPPLHAWFERYGRQQDKAFFGGRDGADVPWELLDEKWGVSVDRSVGLPDDRNVFTGVVTNCCRHWLTQEGGGTGPEAGDRGFQVLACGPLPMLRAVVDLAVEHGWPCLVSVEEHMGCGYGVCRGCVVPMQGGGHATACQDGPVFSAERIDWDLFQGEVRS